METTRLKTSKSFQNGPYVFGVAGSFRMMQILEHCFEPPEPDWDNLERFMARDFSTALRECLKEYGWLEQLDERDSATGGEALVSIGGRLFYVQQDLSAIEPESDYYAIGCGAPYALGSLHTTATLDPPLEAETRVRLSLAAAQEFNAAVREPFVIENYKVPELQVVLVPTRARAEKPPEQEVRKVTRRPKKKPQVVS